MSYPTKDRAVSATRRQFLAGAVKCGVAGSLFSAAALGATGAGQNPLSRSEPGVLFSDGHHHVVELAHDANDHVVAIRIDRTNYWANGRRTRSNQPLRSARVTRVLEEGLEVVTSSGVSTVPIHRQTLLRYYFYVQQPKRQVIELSSHRGVFELRIDGHLVL
ncbi:MAG: hypothetical protein RL885_15510 [Planctomycetota bacterium]